MSPSRSDGSPRLAEGRVEGAALRAALGVDPKRQFRPFTIAEAVYAGRIVADDRNLPTDLVCVGVALDMLAVQSSRQRKTIARRIGILESLVYAYENVWECLSPSARFDMLRDAVRITNAVRAGGER